jgi:tetratricopeptide (TPR) repeat protein
MSVDFDQVRQLYRQNRFLDAYRQTEPLWKDPTSLDRLSAEEAALGRRLAYRIGGYRTYRWIAIRGASRFGDHPLFRGHWGQVSRHKNLLEYLRDFYRRPQLNSGIAEYDCQWLCDNAEMLANVRDFREAARVMEMARSVQDGPDVEECRATMLWRQDRLDEAATIAREVWKAQGGKPSSARLICGILARQGRLDEILETLEPCATTGQSFEITLWMCWYLCARAERSHASEYKGYAQRAYELSLRLPELSPLPDKDTAAAIASARIDCALILGDRATMLENADKIRSGFHKKVVVNLQANPGGKFVLLPYRQVYQKHATCLPTSIVAVLGAFGHEIDADELSQAVTYNGTATWRAVDWLESHGYATRTFVGHRKIWRDLLDAGVPFVLMDMHMSWSHAVAAIGYDDAQGTLILHDPSSERWIQALLEGLEKSEAPFGPECLAIVPADRADLLACIPEDSIHGIAACQNCQKISQTAGHQGCRPIVDELCRRYPSHPFSRRMKALQDLSEGNLFPAIKEQEKLLGEFPDSTSLRLDLVASLGRTRDTARIIQVQGDVVERGLLPSISQNQPWRFPPAPYVAQYADYLGQHVEGMKKAVRLLNRGLFYEPGTSQLYHVLGDVFLRHGQYEQALLPHRLAATLDSTNDHHARALCDTLCRLGQEEEGIQFLRWRVEELGRRIYGAYPWMCLVGALEDMGRPDEAIVAMLQAQEAHRRDVFLQGYASQFWIRMGRWEAAQAALDIARETPGPVYLSAAVEYHRAKGQWPEALQLCEQWVAQEPANIGARRQLLSLIRCRDGSLAMESLARGWMEEHKNDEWFEEVCYEVLQQLFDGRKMDEHLRRRIAHNPLNAWAWRELGFRLVGQLDQAPPDRRAALADELGQVLRKVKELSGDCPPRYALEGDMLSALGDFTGAMDFFFKALEVDPNYSYPYRRLWSLAGRLPLEQQRDLLKRLEEYLFRQTGQLFETRGLSLAVAERLGIEDAEAAVARWIPRRPNDPEIIAAQADLWLSHGRGQSDAQRAVDLLVKATERFVNHAGLRFLLARAYAMLLQEAPQIQAFEEILRRQPLNVQARLNLAMALARGGQTDKAIQLVEEGREFSPGNANAYEAIADVQEFIGRPESSLQTVLAGTQLSPERMSLWERAIRLMQQLGQFDRALETTRKLIALFPDGAYAWYLHVLALGQGPTGNDFVVIEQALRKSLSLNAGLWATAYRLSNLLMHQNRFEDARTVVEQQMRFFEDASNHKAQLARILWVQGQRPQAIDAMAAMLAVWPKTTWGWSELLGWLEQQKDWPTVQKVLHDVPPVMASNAGFRAHRLRVLKKAGWKDPQLDELWQSLLKEFPANEDIHLNRFDVLWDDVRFAEAKGVLEPIQRLHPNSEFIAARRVHVTIRDNPPEALRQAMTIWTNLRELSSWPAAYAWEAIKNYSVAGPAVLQLYDWMMQGKPIRPSAMAGMLTHIHRAQFKRKFWDYLPVSRMSTDTRACVRALTKLLDFLEAHPWDDGRCRAQVLVALSRISRQDGWEYFRTHKSCRENTPMWAEGCRTFLYSSRRWLAQWRRHKDVEMYAVANYTLSIRGKPRKLTRLSQADWREIADSAREALGTLVYDSTPKYLACTLCEAELRLGRNEAFLAAMAQYQGLIQNPDKRFWMQGFEALPPLLPHFERLLKSQTQDPCAAAAESFITDLKSRPAWAVRLWRRLLWKRVSFWKWLTFAIRLS